MLQFGMINRFIASSHKLQFVAYTLICLVLAGCAPGAGLSAVSDALDGKLPVQIKSAGACFIPESAAGTLNCPVYVANLSRELVNMRNLIVSIGFDQNAPVVRFNDTKLLPNATHTFIATFSNSGGRFQPRSTVHLYISASEFGYFTEPNASATNSGSRSTGRTARDNNILPVNIGNYPANSFRIEEAAFYFVEKGFKSMGYSCSLQNTTTVCTSRIVNDTNADVVLDLRVAESYAVDSLGISRAVSVTINKISGRASFVLRAGATFDVETYISATPVQAAIVEIAGLGGFLYQGMGYK
jgi:hypothetical protein